MGTRTVRGRSLRLHLRAGSSLRLKSGSAQDAQEESRKGTAESAVPFGCEAGLLSYPSYGICTGIIALPIGRLAPGPAMVFSRVPAGERNSSESSPSISRVQVMVVNLQAYVTASPELQSAVVATESRANRRWGVVAVDRLGGSTTGRRYDGPSLLPEQRRGKRSCCWSSGTEPSGRQ